MIIARGSRISNLDVGEAGADEVYQLAGGGASGGVDVVWV